MNGELWSKERDAQLRELREQGFSMGYIAVKLGVARNAVIGRAHRLGLQILRQPTRGSQYVQKQEQSRAPKRQSNPFKLLPPSPLQNVESVTIDQQSSGTPIKLFDLQSYHCRWPVSEAPYMFCGDTKQDGSSYCGRHFGISRRGVAKYLDRPAGSWTVNARLKG